jgi:hypothetical protein
MFISLLIQTYLVLDKVDVLMKFYRIKCIIKEQLYNINKIKYNINIYIYISLKTTSDPSYSTSFSILLSPNFNCLSHF